MDISRIMVLNTGGGLAMSKNEKGIYVPRKNVVQMLKDHSRTNNAKFDKTSGDIDPSWLVLPKGEENVTITYNVVEYETIRDSCNLSIDDWIKITNKLKDNYDDYDGFVILHGTDTMAYTAAALSFAIENITKHIILTGSNLPCDMEESNWVDNVITALQIAGSKQFNSDKVTLFFDKTLFQGNRVSNLSNTNSAFFKSPNYDPLLLFKDNVVIENNLPRTIRQSNVTRFHITFNKKVSLVMVYPGINSKMIGSALRSVDGLILLTFGTGNCPTNERELLNEIRSACERGVLIVNCTQCNKGPVTGMYATGSWLIEAGVVPAADMTTEAAFAKLSFLLGREDMTLDEKKAHMLEDMRGELTKTMKL